jgi:MYXO-CTERM domain-containing protein
VPVFSTVAVDTGFLPSPALPISVRFSIVPTGGVVTELAADSHLEWTENGTGAEPILHQVRGKPGGGWFGVDAELDIGTDVQLNLLGIFVGVVPLGNRTVFIEQGEAFDGLLLPESDVESVDVVSSGTPIPLAYQVEVIPTVDLTLGVNLFPELQAELHGVEVATDSGGVVTTQVAEDHWVPQPPDPSRPAEVGMASTWTGDLSASLDLIIEPEVVVSTLFGPFTLSPFEIPVPLGSGQEIRELGPAFYAHGLPVIEVDATPYDFGDVPEGQQRTLELRTDNLGELHLAGEVEVLGDDAFRVFPERIDAPAQTDDGLVVTFAPTAVGYAEAVVLLRTNDPVQPTVEILVSGTGTPELGRDVQRVNGEEARGGSGCGCAHGGASAGWLAAGLVGLVRRRR